MIVQPWCVKEDSPRGVFEWIIWLLYSLELSENRRFFDGFKGGAELNWFAWTCFVWFGRFWGVPLVLRWYSIGILGYSAGVPVNVQLFHHYSGVFYCSAGVPCSVVPCSGVPCFTVSPRHVKFMQETAMFIFLLHLVLSVRVNQLSLKCISSSIWVNYVCVKFVSVKGCTN